LSKHDELANFIVTNVGGEKNIKNLYHCVTRLRFTLKDKQQANKAVLEASDGVISVIESGGQYQVVIGNQVAEVYDSIVKNHNLNLSGNHNDSDQDKKEGNIISRAFTVMSSIFQPIVPALAGAGMLKAILVILTQLNWMDKTSSTYSILSAAGNGVFYFLPLLLAYSSSKTFKTNPYVSVAIMGALLEPNFTKLMEKTGDVTSFINIPVVLMSYSYSIIPAILAIWLFSYLEKALKRFTPKSIELFMVPLVSLLIMVPLTAIIIGPLGVYMGSSIASGIEFLSTKSGLITGAILGAGWTFLVMFGLHWGIAPAMINNISLKGFDTIRPMMASATFAQSGVALGVFLKAKDKKLKSYALSALFPSLFAGITEPIVYGLSIKYKRPMIAAVIGGTVGGAIAGHFKTTVIAYVFPAITTIPAFMTNTIVYYLISIAVAFILTTVLTYVFGFDEGIGTTKKQNMNTTTTSSALNSEQSLLQIEGQIETVYAPATGKIIPLSQVNDPAFSTEAMGKGIAIVPSDGKIYSPISGVVSLMFRTGHAISVTSDHNLEVLIHVGLDTVKLKGTHFIKHAEQGQVIERGDLLIEFDIPKIIEAGYDITTPIIITNSESYQSFEITEKANISTSDVLLTIK
jgi:PTS system beta-glucosides-specific IIC component